MSESQKPRVLPAPLDGCPRCLRRNVVPWRSWLADATPQVTLYGDYRCPACDCTWWTGWNVETI